MVGMGIHILKTVSLLEKQKYCNVLRHLVACRTLQLGAAYQVLGDIRLRLEVSNHGV